MKQRKLREDHWRTLVRVSDELRASLKDVSDLTAGQERALRFALERMEKYLVGLPFDSEKFSADMALAASILEWASEDVAGECPHVPA